MGREKLRHTLKAAGSPFPLPEDYLVSSGGRSPGLHLFWPPSRPGAVAQDQQYSSLQLREQPGTSTRFPFHASAMCFGNQRKRKDNVTALNRKTAE